MTDAVLRSSITSRTLRQRLIPCLVLLLLALLQCQLLSSGTLSEPLPSSVEGGAFEQSLALDEADGEDLFPSARYVADLLPPQPGTTIVLSPEGLPSGLRWYKPVTRAPPTFS